MNDERSARKISLQQEDDPQTPVFVRRAVFQPHLPRSSLIGWAILTCVPILEDIP